MRKPKSSNKIRILCYGDSNTWGYSPDSITRYERDCRWTGVMQKRLGNNYEVLEEGHCGRTTSYTDTQEFGLNGSETLPLVLSLYAPLDLVLIMLGTNDLKRRYNATTIDILEGLNDLVSIVKRDRIQTRHNTQIIIIAPPVIIDNANSLTEEIFGGSRCISENLGKAITFFFQDTDIHTIDLSAKICSSRTDGIHLEPEEHVKLGKLVGDNIIKIYKS